MSEMDKSEHYDVGVVGWWFASNYGSGLTYYGLGKILEDLSLKPIMIPVSKINKTPWEPETLQTIKFIEKYFPISQTETYENRRNYNSVCDSFILGSDQLWNKGAIDLLGYTFFLDFANESKRCFAYATSFGNSEFGGTKEQNEKIKILLDKFDYISVREESGVAACKKYFDKDVKRDLDPVFLCDKKHYDQLADNSTADTGEDKYILCYILDVNEEKQKAIKYASEKLGLPFKVVLDLKSGKRQREKCTIGNILETPSIEDFVKYIKNCSMLITDSHHGACFGAIYEKNMITIANAGRGLTRFTHLFDMLGIKDRLVSSPEEILEKDYLFGDIDYSIVRERLNQEKISSHERFEHIAKLIKSPLSQNNVVSQLDKEKCVGCSSCVSKCPKDALTLTPDKWGYYRATIEYSKCVDCGLCVKSCPVIEKPANNNSNIPDCYEFVAADNEILINSSSGGAFSVLAKEAFKRNGVVVGAAWKDDFSVEHIIIENENEMPKLRKSKYLQSYLGNRIFNKVKEKLDEGIFVLFTGCPCQVAGLKSFLKKDYDNLIMVDLLCSNSPSSVFFKKYIESIENKTASKITEYEFRHKKQWSNWDCNSIKYINGNTEKVIDKASEDDYLRVFHNHTMCAPHCEKCEFQKSKRYGDITIGDFWEIARKDQNEHFDCGVSALIVNNSKGNEFVKAIDTSDVRLMKKVPYEWVGGNGFTANNKNFASPQRDIFYNYVQNMDFSEAVNYALKPNHGQYNSIFINCSPLAYNVNQTHFKFDSLIWEEHFIKGSTVLITKPVNPPSGKFAILPLNNRLYSNREYMLCIKFKIKTNDKIYNFHVKDSGSNYYKVIHTHKISPQDANNWVEINTKFSLNTDIFDEFMIGAAQLKGEGAFIKFDYIIIKES